MMLNSVLYCEIFSNRLNSSLYNIFVSRTSVFTTKKFLKTYVAYAINFKCDLIMTPFSTRLNSIDIKAEHPKSTSAVKHLYQIATKAFKEVLIKTVVR